MELEPKAFLDLTLSSGGGGVDVEPLFQQLDPARVFSCNYCQRKFYSSQALGGHQNAHKLERSLAKRSRQAAAMSVVDDVHPHPGGSSGAHHKLLPGSPTSTAAAAAARVHSFQYFSSSSNTTSAPGADGFCSSDGDRALAPAPWPGLTLYGSGLEAAAAGKEELDLSLRL